MSRLEELVFPGLREVRGVFFNINVQKILRLEQGGTAYFRRGSAPPGIAVHSRLRQGRDDGREPWFRAGVWGGEVPA